MSPLIEWLTGGGGVAALGAIAKVLSGASKTIKDLSSDINYLKVKLAKETGGNSNGLRQAVNEIKSDVADVREAVAEVRGAFSQHVQEGGK